jgi:hypothetical protein
LHVFKVDVKGLVNVHRTLHPRRAEVQVAGVAVVREIDFWELNFFLGCHVCSFRSLLSFLSLHAFDHKAHALVALPFIRF